MAEHAAAEALTPPELGDFVLKKVVRYPNGGASAYYEHETTALIVDEGIYLRDDNEPVFDYSLITSKQNEYMARYDRVFRLRN